MDEGLSRAVVEGLRRAPSRRPDLQGQAAGQLGPEAADRDLRPRGAAGRDQGQPLASALSDRGQDVQPRRSLDLHRRRDDAARDDARRHRRRRASGRRALSASGRQARRSCRWSAADPDRRRRLFRSGEGLRRGQDHAGARLQRFRGRQAARSAAINIFDARAAWRSSRTRIICADCPKARDAGGRVPRPRPLRRAQAIVARLEAVGFLEKIEPTTHMVPHGDRSGVVIEPYLTDQWYVDAKTLAQPAIAAVRAGATIFVPKNWEKTYFDWMENIQPWCISRQLWWGHQIPAWYGPDGKVFVAETEEEAVGKALGYYVEQEVITRRAGARDGARPCQARRLPHARRGRARHLVLLGAVAVLDARLAGRDAGTEALLPDRRRWSRASTSSSSGSPG